MTVPEAASAARALRKAANFSVLADDDSRRARPARGERAHVAFDMRQGRQNDLERARLALGGGDRCAEIGHQPLDHRAARAGQGEDQRRRRGAPARLRFARPQFGEPLDQRMADVDAARSAEPRMRFRLERQQRQHAIDIGAHRPRPARPPRPDRRADVIDHRQIRQRAADAPRDAVGEVGAVDDDERVGARCDDRRRGAADAVEERRQALDDRQNPHHRDVGEREQALQPFGGHRIAADAEEFDAAAGLLAERPHQLEAELVAGRLAGDDGEAQATRRSAHGA